MKYIKTFENIEDEPKVGDYVIINRISNLSDKIGEIVDIIDIKKDWKIDWKDLLFQIKYINVPKAILQRISNFANYRIIKGSTVIVELSGRSISEWSTDREYLEVIISAKKYNI